MDKALEGYMLLKRVLAIRILEQANEKAKTYLRREIEELRKTGRKDLLKLLKIT
ncbi:MAG: hypothetical protein ABIH76_07250 [Candidatus Bathyarchaeota archaeon]